MTSNLTVRESLVRRGLRTSRRGTYYDRLTRLSRRASAKRFGLERSASACMEVGLIELGARLYDSALHHHRRAVRLGEVK